MNKKFLVSYQNREESKEEIFQKEVPTREEADDLAEDLETEGYENIIIEEIRE